MADLADTITHSSEAEAAFLDIEAHFGEHIPDDLRPAFIYEGRAIGLELKTARGRQSPEQLDFERRLKAAGGSYWVARTLAEVELVLAAENIGTKAKAA